MTSKVTRTKAEYEWEVVGEQWASTHGRGGVTTFSHPNPGNPEPRHIVLTLEATHYPNQGMDVTMTHGNIFTGKQGSSHGRSTSEFVGLPSVPLDRLVKLFVTKPIEVKTPSQTRLAELKVPVSEFARFEISKLVGRTYRRVGFKRIRIKDGQVRDRDLLQIDPVVRRELGKSMKIMGLCNPATKLPIEVCFESSKPASKTPRGLATPVPMPARAIIPADD